MPYLLISTQIRMEIGPTLCGDEKQDPQLMKELDAHLKDEPGQSFRYYESSLAPRVVLNRLEGLGYRVISSTGCGQTLIWTLHK